MSKLARINKVMSDAGHQGKIAGIIESAKVSGHQHFVNGHPCNKELMEFVQGVQKAMPKAKFYPNTFGYISIPVKDEQGNYQTTKQYKVCDEFFVYMDDFPFDIGRVGWADNAVNGNGEYSYSVYSRKIQNAKFALHRDQHHMIMSKDMGKAVKNACKYLVPYTTRELAQAFYEPLHTNVSKVLDDVKSKMNYGAQGIVNNRMAILQEVQALVKQGAQFVTPEFRDLASKVEQLIADYAEQDKRRVSAVFVRFKQVGDDTYVDVQDVMNVREIRWDAQMNLGSLATTYPLNELPQDIAEQVSVLSILENDGYVAGVGMKIDETTFWVERG